MELHSWTPEEVDLKTRTEEQLRKTLEIIKEERKSLPTNSYDEAYWLDELEYDIGAELDRRQEETNYGHEVD